MSSPASVFQIIIPEACVPWKDSRIGVDRRRGRGVHAQTMTAHGIDSGFYGEMFETAEMRRAFSDEHLVELWLRVEVPWRGPRPKTSPRRNLEAFGSSVIRWFGGSSEREP